MNLKNNEYKNPGPSNYYANYDAQLTEWSQKLKEFKSNLDKINKEFQAEAKSTIDNLEEKFNEASYRIEELKGEGLIAKDDIKTKFESAWKDLLSAYESAKKTFH